MKESDNFTGIAVLMVGIGEWIDATKSRATSGFKVKVENGILVDICACSTYSDDVKACQTMIKIGAKITVIC